MRTLPFCRWILLLLLSLLIAVSCGDSSDDDDDLPEGDDDAGDDDDDTDEEPLPGFVEIPAGNMNIRIRTDPYQMEVFGENGETLLATADPLFPPDLPETKDLTGKINLSAMPFWPHAFQAGDFGSDWYYARRALKIYQVGEDWVIVIQAANIFTGEEVGTINLLLQFPEDDHFSFTQGATGVEDIQYHMNAYRLDTDEEFFGLGLQYDGIGSRGKIRNMFLGLGVDLTDQIQNHAPMPFYISTRGYGLFVEEYGKGYFDMGYGADDAYGYKYRTQGLKTHVFYGPDPLEVIDSYTDLTGKPPMNPDYMFGHLHWRNVNHNETEMYYDMEELRAHGIPTSSFMVDAPWATAYNTFRFAECDSGCLFEDAQAVIDTAHDSGYAFYLWTADFINKTSPIEAPGQVEDNSEQFNFARDNGYLIPIIGFLWEYPWWHDKGAMVNFLNPAAYGWFESETRNVMEMGVQGFKMDGGEYPGADTLGLYPLDLLDMGGFGETNTAHYYYKWMYHHMFWNLAREYNGDLGIATVRCAVWGEQTHISFFWPGDMESNWGTALGLPAEIAGGLTLGTAGFPYYGANNGGFTSYGQDQELLFARWTAYSAFRPIFESSRTGTQDIWEIYPPWIEEMYRKYAVIHTRLFPYMKAYAKTSTQTGAPIMRMLPLHFMDDPNTYSRDFDYMLGEWLLVAPVYIEEAYEREVYLPDGRWVNYWTNEVHSGPAKFTVPVERDEIPVYARGGAIIPMLDESVETLWPTDNPSVVDHEDVENLLWLDVYPYGESSFTMADGSILKMNQTESGFELFVTAPTLVRTYSVRAVPGTYGGEKPANVTGPSGSVLTEYATYAEWDAAASGWYYDESKGNLWMRDTCLDGWFVVE